MAERRDLADLVEILVLLRTLLVQGNDGGGFGHGGDASLRLRSEIAATHIPSLKFDGNEFPKENFPTMILKVIFPLCYPVYRNEIHIPARHPSRGIDA